MSWRLLWSFRVDESLKRVNVMFIVIVPKREGATSIKEYRPINLAESIHKIISKAFSPTHRKVLDKTVFFTTCFCGGKADFGCNFVGT